MKQITTLINGALAGILIFILFAAGLPYNTAQAKTTTQDTDVICNTGRSIQVSGTAVVNVLPDRALIQLGVQSNGMTPSKVEAANTKAIQQITTALSHIGVDAKDITTDHYVIDPIYEDYDDLYIKGYRINNVVAITLRDVNKTSQVLVAALEAGANEVIDVELYTSELRKYRDQARELAMQAAGEKAQALANTAGSTTGCVLTINENTWSYYNGWWYRGYGRDNSNLWMQNTVQNVTPSESGNFSSSDDGPISLGQISIRAEVNVSYSLK